MVEKQKIIVVTCDDHEEKGVVAVFSNPILVRDFLNRPLAEHKTYEVEEHDLNPEFSLSPGNIYHVIYNAVNPDNIIVNRLASFQDECEGLKEEYAVFEEQLYVTIFDESEEQAIEQASRIYKLLQKSGKWAELVEVEEEKIFSNLYLKYKFWDDTL